MKNLFTLTEKLSASFCVMAILSLMTVLPVFAAEKLPAQLQNVGFKERLGAQVNLGLKFRNEKGEVVPIGSVFDGKRPVMLFLAYYGCPNLCNLFLNGVTDSLKNLEWTPGKEFQIVTVSIDPTEDPRLATGKKASHLEALGRAEASAGWHFWVNDVERPAPGSDGQIDESTSVRQLANEVGFGYRYDFEQSQYAHSAGIVMLTPEGKVSRYLYGIEFRPKELRLALVEASNHKIGTMMDRLLLFCYNYDPKTRKYSLYATNLIRAGGGLTILILGGFLVSGWRRRQSSASRDVA